MTTETTEAGSETQEATTQTEATDKQFRLPPQLDKESDADYRKRIREEAKAHRLAAEEWERKAKDAEAKLQAAEQAKAEEIESLRVQSRNQFAISKIEAIAVKEGALDTDVIEKLLNPADFAFDEAGKITNAQELVTKLKAEKAYLFGSVSTASTAKVPSETDVKAKPALQLSDEEWEARKRKYNL